MSGQHSIVAEGHQPNDALLCDTCPNFTLWPCDPRREMLLRQYSACPAVLLAYMTTYMINAMLGSPDVPAGDVYRRFLGWVDQQYARRPMGMPPNGRTGVYGTAAGPGPLPNRS